VATKVSATTLRLRRQPTKVKLAYEGLGGGNYLQADLDTGPIECVGYQLADHGDGSFTNCLIVVNKDGRYVSRAMEMFVVLEDEEVTNG
jgi:hypothetical protein